MTLLSVNFENIHYPNLVSRGVFRTLSNIFDGVFLQKQFNCLQKDPYPKYSSGMLTQIRVSVFIS